MAEQVQAALWDARMGGRTPALLLLDLDGLTSVNDRYGHAAGDEVLAEIAGRLRSSLRRTDLLARLGGDEFVVALHGLDPVTAQTEACRSPRRYVQRSVGPSPCAVGRCRSG
jgi:diguanylate cyclase (GGDEF)-like protein